MVVISFVLPTGGNPTYTMGFGAIIDVKIGALKREAIRLVNSQFVSFICIINAPMGLSSTVTSTEPFP